MVAAVELVVWRIDFEETYRRGLPRMRWPRAHLFGGPFSAVFLLFKFTEVSIGVTCVVVLVFCVLFGPSFSNG